MNKTLTILSSVAMALTLASAALAESKPAKPKVCAVFSEGTVGASKLGICAPTKAGGKPVYLRSYSIVEVTNPDTGKTDRVMIGFR